MAWQSENNVNTKLKQITAQSKIARNDKKVFCKEKTNRLPRRK